MKKILLSLLLICFIKPLFAQDPNEGALKILKVSVSSMNHCVIVEEDEAGKKKVSGFEIDLLKELVQELALKGLVSTTFETKVVEFSEIGENIRNGSADMGCSGITIRSNRMDWCDFSIPTLNSGLGIMVLKKEAGMFNGLILMYRAVKGPVLFFATFVVIFAIIIWWLERDKNPDNDENGISDSFFPGVFEAIYFCIVTCSTVGYGDFSPKKWRTRVVVGVLIIVGLIAFGNFLSLISVARIENSIGDIKGLDDLKGKVVLTQKGTTSAEFAKNVGASKVKAVDNINSACDGLLLERGDAVIFDYPVLLNYVKENSDKVRLAGEMFDKQYYGFMLPKDCELKREIDTALLKLYENGTYDTLYKKWF